LERSKEDKSHLQVYCWDTGLQSLDLRIEWPILGRRQGRYNFSKVCSLLNSPCKRHMELTFADRCQKASETEGGGGAAETNFT